MRSGKAKRKLQRGRARDLQFDELKDKNDEKCDSDKKSTCAPTLAPSISSMPSAQPSSSPSASPTISHEPTVSFAPSQSPTVSMQPSGRPSARPSPAPSGMPSPMPSPQPSAFPTRGPTTMPSGMPSPQPTASPTKDPFQTVTSIITNPNGETGVNTNCWRPIPDTAEMTEDQAIIFDYTLNLKNGSDTALSMDLIATRLHSEVSAQFLDCRFDPGNEFYVHALTSLPTDVLEEEEGCDVVSEGADCYVVNAAFLSRIFYLEPSSRRRQLQANGTSLTITDPNVLDSFSTAIADIFASGSLWEGFSDIVSADFQAITNADTNIGTIPTEEDSSKSLSAGAIAGSTVGAIVGVAIIAALIIFALTRFQREPKEDEREISSGLSDIESLDDISDDVSRAMIGDKSILSDDVSFYTSDNKAYVLNDVQSLDTAGFYPEIDSDSYAEREPKFQPVETVLKYREHGVSDTVDL